MQAPGLGVDASCNQRVADKDYHHEPHCRLGHHRLGLYLGGRDCEGERVIGHSGNRDSYMVLQGISWD